MRAALLVCLAASAAGADDLTPLLAAPGATVVLDGSTTYTIAEYALTTDKTIFCNGAEIRSTGGPIRASAAGVDLVVDDCRITGSGWALLGALAGGRLVVRNGTQLTCSGPNSAIYVEDSTLDVDGGTIDQCRWGANMENADAALHGTTMTDVEFGVQNVAGAVTLDGGSSLTNLDAGNPGAGVSIIASSAHPARGASAVIHDTTFIGFGNAVDIQPSAATGLPPGTVEIVGSTFRDAVYSALAAVDATGVRVARSRVLDTKTDGIFLVNSTGVIEDTEIVDSLNSGVSFYGCPDGFTLRRSLVRGSVHQGVAVVADPVNDRPSHGIRLVDTTLADNVIANVLVDERSDVAIQGGIFSGAPDMSLRFHGSPSATLTAGLLLDSEGGLEVKSQADVAVALSVFARHAHHGTLVYANATAAFAHCAFASNGLDPMGDDYSLFANSGAAVTVAHSTLGPAGDLALYDNAGETLTATNNYWGDPSGPEVPSGGGTGAVIGMNGSNGSEVLYDPFRTAPPLDVEVHDVFALDADATTTWESATGITLALTGRSGVASVPAGRVAALRVRDTTALTTPAPPVGTATDGVVVVWAEFDLLSRSASGSLRLPITGDGSAITLSRLDPDGQWVPAATTWDGGAGELVYAPLDPRDLQGVFAFGDGEGCTTARACLAPLVGASFCAEPLPAKLRKAVDRRIRKAITKLGKAVATTKPPKAARLVAQARRALLSVENLANKFTRVASGAIPSTCRDAIVTAIAPAHQRIEAGAL